MMTMKNSSPSSSTQPHQPHPAFQIFKPYGLADSPPPPHTKSLQQCNYGEAGSRGVVAGTFWATSSVTGGLTGEDAFFCLSESRSSPVEVFMFCVCLCLGG